MLSCPSSLLLTCTLQGGVLKDHHPSNGRYELAAADVKYRKNEAFVDVVEMVNLSMSAKGLLKEFSYLSLLPTKCIATPQAQFDELTWMATSQCVLIFLVLQSANLALMTS